VLHGEPFRRGDSCAKWLAHLGDRAYGMALRWNDLLFAVRKRLGLPYWSLSSWLKHKVKNAVRIYLSSKRSWAREAKLRGVDGVVCGHITMPKFAGSAMSLPNDGDWLKAAAPCRRCHGTMEILSLGGSFAKTTSPDAGHRFPAGLPALRKPRLYPRRTRRLQPGPVPAWRPI